MRDWRQVLKTMVHIHLDYETSQDPNRFPLSAYGCDANPPSKEPWPIGLVTSPAIQEFYHLCNGADFGTAYSWEPIENLCEINELWIDTLKNYEAGGVLQANRHLVLGRDSAGAPLIWDSQTDRVATFWWKGGDWEPIADSMEQFLTDLVNPADSEDVYWHETLRKLDQKAAQLETPGSD